MKAEYCTQHTHPCSLQLNAAVRDVKLSVTYRVSTAPFVMEKRHCHTHSHTMHLLIGCLRNSPSQLLLNISLSWPCTSLGRRIRHLVLDGEEKPGLRVSKRSNCQLILTTQLGNTHQSEQDNTQAQMLILQ